MMTTVGNTSSSSSHHRLDKVAAMLSTPEGRVGARRGKQRGGSRQGNMVRLCSNPIPAGRAAACDAFHNSGGFLGGEGGRAAFLHSRSHQSRRATSKATQALGVDDCNPPLGPLLATSSLQPSNTHTHAHMQSGLTAPGMCTLQPPSFLPRLTIHSAAALIIAH